MSFLLWGLMILKTRDAGFHGVKQFIVLEKSSSLLTRLRSMGILNQHSHGSATYYTIPENYLGSEAENGLVT